MVADVVAEGGGDGLMEQQSGGWLPVVVGDGRRCWLSAVDGLVGVEEEQGEGRERL